MEIESHPRLDFKNLLINQKKIILGSFPIWSLSVNSSQLTGNARIERTHKPSEFPYFYGSSKNLLWTWYHKYLDAEVLFSNIDSIKYSLGKNQIGITDVILSCERKGKSSLDKHLSKRSYNHTFFSYPKKGETLKILCTSKGVMNEMLLSKDFFNLHKKIRINHTESSLLQIQLVKKTNGDISLIKKPIFVELTVDNGGRIQCLSIPSPGSPYRKLNDFGITGTVNLDNYLFEAFKWLRD